MKKIGILGGTFDPIHFGHLAIAQAASVTLKLDKVVFVPAYIPPHKKGNKIVSSRQRLQMVKLAIAGNKYFDLSDYEIKKGDTSYSVETAQYFKEHYPKGAKLFFIVGEDTAAQLHTWKKINELSKIVSFVSINRLGYKAKQTKVKVRSIVMPNLEISSSYLRQSVKKNKPLRYLMPENVIKYIKKNKLYV